MKKLIAFALFLVSSLAFAAAIVAKSTPINGVSAGSNYTQSIGTFAGNADRGSYHCNWRSLTGVLTGHFDIEVSNDNGATWVSKTATNPDPQSSGEPVAMTLDATGANGAGAIILQDGEIMEELYRVKWVKEGVTGGTVSCFVILKG